MELKGKQAENFIKALDESEKKNNRKDIPFKAYVSMGKDEIKAIYNDPTKPTVTVVPEIDEDSYNQKELKYNPKPVKECTITTEWIEDETENEEEIPVEVVEVIKKCDCGGEFEYTPGMTQTLEYPPHYTHTCNKCGKVERFLKTYPYQKYKRI